MAITEVVLIALVVVAVLAVVAQRLRLPYPVLLVIGGIGLGFAPGLPRISLQPEIVFLLFIPPLILSTAWRASWRELRANLAPILLLAIGLVLATTAAVAAIVHLTIPGIAWRPAFVLGATVAATDPTAVAAIARRMHIPSRIVSILEGESLGNDATSLVTYRIAVAAVVMGTFSLKSAFLEFLFDAAVGGAVGLAVAFLYAWLQQRLDNPSVEVLITLLLPFAAYIPADQLGASGVLAVVAAGIYAGRREHEIHSSRARLQATAVWDTIVFVLNGLIFVLLGLQLPAVLEGVSRRPALLLARDAAIVLGAVVLVRIVWMAAVAAFLSLLRRAIRLPGQPLIWRAVPVLAWAGMRGAITLVIALSIPLGTGSGLLFPDRATIIFLTSTVIVATLLVQTLTLPPLIHRAGLEEDNSSRETARAHAAAHEAAVRRIDELARERTLPSVATRLRSEHERLAEILTARAEGTLEQATAKSVESLQHLRQEIVDAQRREVIGMYNRDEISDDALRAVLHELDLEEQKLD